jgi:diguanylate cyclase (GGDEF)-like protein
MLSTTTRAMLRGVEGIGVAALIAALVVAAFLASGVVGWNLLLLVYRTSGPILLIVATLLAWRAGRRADLPSVRRYWRLMAAAFALTALDAGIALVYATANSLTRYPLALIPIQVADLAAVVLAVAAVLVIPVRVAWSTSRLRLGLDLATVMLSAAVFLWHFSVADMLGDGADLRSAASALAVIGGCLVGVFAVARVTLAGAVGVRRGALLALAAAGLTTVVAETLTPALIGTPYLNVVLSLTVLFYAWVIAAPLLQLRAPPAKRPDRGRRGRPYSILPFVAIVATQALLVTILLDGDLVGAWVVLAGVIALTGLVVARQIVALRDNSRLVVRLDESLAAQHQAVARSQVLANTGTALMTALDAERIVHLTADAGAKLLADHPADRSMVIAPVASAEVIAVAGGLTTAPPVDGRIAEVWESVRSRFGTGAPVVGDDLVAALELMRISPGLFSRWAVLLPLGNADHLFGVVVADGGTAVSADLAKSLDTLRTQVTLALERVTLTVELTRRAMHDPLTGLANRALIHESIEHALAGSQGAGDHVGVLLLDLNHFKQINDTLGHEAGDDLLCEVAHRLRNCVRGGGSADGRSEGTIGRLGGDEFVIIVPHLRDVDSACAIAERVTRALTPPMTCAGRKVPVRASIGVALSGDQASGVDDLLRRADTAMYAAKRRSADGDQWYALAVADLAAQGHGL